MWNEVEHLSHVPSQEALSHTWFSQTNRMSSAVSSQKGLDQLGLGNTMLQRLRSYAMMSSFQQEVMRMAVVQLDGAHLAGIKVGATACDSGESSPVDVPK